MSGAPVESRRRLERGAQAVLGCGLERGCSRRREWGNNIGKGRERRCGERLLPPAGPGPALRLPARPLPCPIPGPFTAESPARNPERKAALVQAEHLFSAAIFLTPFCLSLSFFCVGAGALSRRIFGAEPFPMLRSGSKRGWWAAALLKALLCHKVCCVVTGTGFLKLFALSSLGTFRRGFFSAF